MAAYQTWSLGMVGLPKSLFQKDFTPRFRCVRSRKI